jgi:hypothetical protein
MKRWLLIAAAAVFFSASMAVPLLLILPSWNLEGVRRIDVPFKDGYGDFGSTVITSDAELTEFIVRVAGNERPVDRRPDLVDLLPCAGIDFRREA